MSSDHVLIEDAESVGASDAGIYVGQTNKAIIRNSRAAYDVFGFEIENVQDGEYDGNLAECNTGGFLVYDPDRDRWTGTSPSSASLAQAYGLTDVDGSVPDIWRYFAEHGSAETGPIDPAGYR